MERRASSDLAKKINLFLQEQHKKQKLEVNTKQSKQEKYETLENFLKDISKEDLSEKEYKNAEQTLRNIYCDGAKFRHKYSRITAYLIDISNDSPKILETITNNIDSLYTRCFKNNIQTSKECENFQDSIDKLIDHINLEYIRLKDILGTKENIKESKAFQNQFKAFQKSVEKIQKEVEASKKEYVTILGIFASIVLGFVGVFTFSTAMFQSLDKASAYIILTSICVGGIVVGNILFILFETIKSITYKSSSKPFWVIYGVFNFILIAIFLFVIFLK